MKKLPALATVAAGILLLSGCSQASTLAACGQVAAQAVQVTGVIETVSSPTPETAQAALDEISGIVENVRGIDGPAHFVTLRDAWTTSIDTFIAETELVIAGTPGDLNAATAEVQTATEAIVTYCTP